MAGRSAGQATFTLKLNDQLTGKFAGIGAKLKRGAQTIGRGFVAAGRTMLRFGQLAVGGLAAAGAAALGAAKAFADFGDRIGKMSARTGVSAQSLQELKFAAEQSGTSLEAVSNGIFRMTRRIGNFGTGGGPAARALRDMGLEGEKLSRMKPEDQFNAMVEALGGIEDASLRSQYGFEIFGDAWKQMKPLIDQGPEGLRKLREERRALGPMLSDEDIANAEMLTDEFNKLKTTAVSLFLKIGATIGKPMMEQINRLTTGIKNLWENFGAGLTIADIMKMAELSVRIGLVRIKNWFSDTGEQIGLVFGRKIVFGLTNAFKSAGSLIERLPGGERIGNLIRGVGIAGSAAAKAPMANFEAQIKSNRKARAADEQKLIDSLNQLTMEIAKRARERTDAANEGAAEAGKPDEPDVPKAAEEAASQISSLMVASGFAASRAGSLAASADPSFRELQKQTKIMEEIAEQDPAMIGA